MEYGVPNISTQEDLNVPGCAGHALLSRYREDFGSLKIADQNSQLNKTATS